MLLVTGLSAAADSPPVFDVAQHKGKVVVVDFWASWCVPCRRSFPWMNDMQEKYREQGLVIAGINEDNAWQDAVEFLKRFRAGFDIVRDTGGSIASDFDVVAMPSTYVFDRDGKLVARHLGFKERLKGEYEATLREALGRPSSDSARPSRQSD